LYRSAPGLAGRYGESRLADPHQSPARPIRTHGPVERRSGISGVLQLVRLPVLALPVRPEGNSKDRPDRDRISADAEGRKLQSRGGEGADREGDSSAQRKLALTHASVLGGLGASSEAALN